MSNSRLPPELLDHIVDLLHDSPYPLRNCCLVSKSWIPRTRKHLFADISFYTSKHLQSWRETFPDPSTSPARYAKTLLVGCSHAVTPADGGPGGWITGFCHVVHLEVVDRTVVFPVWTDGFVPFHGFPSIIKSLHLNFIYLPPKALDLIISFPLLEDLAITAFNEVTTHNNDSSDEPPVVVQPSSLPMFTGSLNLSLGGGMRAIARQLLSLPGGLHFRKLTFEWSHKEDPPLATAFVEECSRTLESLDITCETRREPWPVSVDLSKATKLEGVVFRPVSPGVEWITTALRTVTSEHRTLQQISIYVPFNSALYDIGIDIGPPIGETTRRQWSGLDHLLIHLWESRSIRPKLVCMRPKWEERDIRDVIESFLPEVTGRGVGIDLVEI